MCGYRLDDGRRGEWRGGMVRVGGGRREGHGGTEPARGCARQSRKRKGERRRREKKKRGKRKRKREKKRKRKRREGGKRGKGKGVPVGFAATVASRSRRR